MNKAPLAVHKDGLICAPLEVPTAASHEPRESEIEVPRCVWLWDRKCAEGALYSTVGRLTPHIRGASRNILHHGKESQHVIHTHKQNHGIDLWLLG